MKTILFSDDESFYYVEEMACPKCHWVSTKKFTTKEEALEGSKSALDPTGLMLGGAIRVTLKDDIVYYRTVLSFIFWKVKQHQHKEKQVEDNDELVLDYMPCHKDLR
jgi:hypothetical protein